METIAGLIAGLADIKPVFQGISKAREESSRLQKNWQVSDFNNDDVDALIHICRDHFKDFSVDEGLFGKIHGTFW